MLINTFSWFSSFLSAGIIEENRILVKIKQKLYLLYGLGLISDDIFLFSDELLCDTRYALVFLFILFRMSIYTNPRKNVAVTRPIIPTTAPTMLSVLDSSVYNIVRGTFIQTLII